MNIQVINFEVCQDHYQITRMLKTTPNNQLEYLPYHLFVKKEADCYFLIGRLKDIDLLKWCQEAGLPSEKIIVLSDRIYPSLNSWEAPALFEKETDFEKICQWLMAIREKGTAMNFFQNWRIDFGKIRKEHSFDLCIKAVQKQYPGLKNSRVFLFVKEKSHVVLPSENPNDLSAQQLFLKGIADTYDYLVFQPV